MQVTNETGFCFVLAAGVIIQPNAVNTTVDDGLYQADSTLNAQIDALQGQNLITITGKPSDTFPDAPAFTPPVIIQSLDSGQTVLAIEGAVSQQADEFLVADSTGLYGVYVRGIGNLQVLMDQTQGAFEVKPDVDGSGDFGGGLSVTAAGDVYTFANVLMFNLPTADPHVANQLWNSAGTLKVSAG